MKRFITKSKFLLYTVSLAVIVFGLVAVMPADVHAEEPHNHDGYDAYDGETSKPASGSYYLTSDITLTETWNVTGTLNLCLDGHTIDANGGNYSAITIASGATLNLYDCGAGSITGSHSSTSDSGGGVTNNGTFNMYGGTISGNTVSFGGGVYSGAVSGTSGTFNMYGGTISGNTASTNGGGVYSSNNSTFNMYGGTISDNTTSGNGGGVSLNNGGTFNMSGSSRISGNNAVAGGGVHIASGSFTMSGGSIENNTASASSGGVQCSGNFSMSGGSISGNQAKKLAGVYVLGSGKNFSMTGGNITNNAATESYGGLVAISTTLGGSAQITGNTAGGKASNASLLHGQTISLSSPSDMKVGVNLYSASTDDSVAITDEGVDESYLNYFTSDSNAYEIKFDTNQLFLVKRSTPLPPDPDPDPEPQPEQPKAPEEEPELQLEEENYVPNIVQNDKTQFGKENEGSVPTGAYNFSTYVSPSGFAKGVEKIADKKDAKGNITVYSGKPLTINKELLNTLTAKKVSMTYYFTYKGHLYCVTIPAGVNPARVLDKNGHGGPLYVGWLLGTSRLIK